MAWELLAAAAIPAIASYFGASATNKANQAIAQATSAKNMKMMREANVFSREEALKGRQFSKGETTVAWNRNLSSMREQMAWQEKMSGSAYQRSMQDLRTAGLNPILAYAGSGATTPSGSAASTSAPSASTATGRAGQAAMIPMLNEMEAAITSGKEGLRLSQELKNMRQAEVTDRARQHQLYQDKVKKNAETGLLAEQKNNAIIQRQILEHDVSSAKSMAGIRARELTDVTKYGTSTLGKNLGGILRILDTLGIKDGLQNLFK